MGIPKHNGLRDDVQLLWSGSALNNYGYNSPSDIGPGNNQFIYSLYNTQYARADLRSRDDRTGTDGQRLHELRRRSPSLLPFGIVVRSESRRRAVASLGCGPTYLGYADAVAYNVPFGTPIATSPATIKAPGVYFAPNTPAHAFDGPIPLYDNSINVNQNDAGITKLQYTYALSQVGVSARSTGTPSTPTGI